MKIIFSDKADKQLSRLNPFIADKIIKSIRKFQNGERVDIQKLHGRLNEFRIRVGDYRVILEKLPNGDFSVLEIGQRENIYFFEF
ncbi:type II toxin-antitoxin system RelE/ParE family toxin [Candidatus Pacearchaeota archaeon]|nr:type II toxin-antitoxin system RelE/ParE family toxin [Candidatus Pacearchaeota archaeon]